MVTGLLFFPELDVVPIPLCCNIGHNLVNLHGIKFSMPWNNCTLKKRKGKKKQIMHHALLGQNIP